MKPAAQQKNHVAPTLTYGFADDLLNGIHTNIPIFQCWSVDLGIQLPEGLES
jgi:hypothetical protein